MNQDLEKNSSCKGLEYRHNEASNTNIKVNKPQSRMLTTTAEKCKSEKHLGSFIRLASDRSTRKTSVIHVGQYKYSPGQRSLGLRSVCKCRRLSASGGIIE